MIKKLIVLPTWILVGILKPILREEHPWKSKKFKLEDWVRNSTELNIVFSKLLWLSILCILDVLLFI